MPIGASKVGALGGLVPGGSVTFNTTDTWVVPPGVKIVSITGKGGTGNPGNAGNQGNAGNPGTGGAGGGAGAGRLVQPPNTSVAAFGGNPGGHAFKTINNPGNPFIPFNDRAYDLPTKYAIYGLGAPSPANTNGNPGQSGASGNAGTAGNPGNPGNPGQQSSGLSNTFPGGAGGNAGVAGSAGTAGAGGTGGGGGNSATNPNVVGNGGAGGNGGGSGGYGGCTNLTVNQVGGFAQGGGGAGTVNSGQSGQAGTSVNPFPTHPYNTSPAGGTGNFSAPINNNPVNQAPFVPVSPNTDGGAGGGMSLRSGGPSVLAIRRCPNFAQNILAPLPCTVSNRNAAPQFSPPAAPNLIVRAGAGGGAACGDVDSGRPQYALRGGGGGGGGGRGNLGGCGGPTPTPTGSAGTPATYNCVPVTPGSSYPIVVGTPGGQVVISWNPQ